jgi:hypothetical protein
MNLLEETVKCRKVILWTEYTELAVYIMVSIYRYRWHSKADKKSHEVSAKAKNLI